jgi:hypothetical protein
MKCLDCDNQSTSPLCKSLTPELRNWIYDFVFQPVVFEPSEASIIAALVNGRLKMYPGSCTPAS